MSHVFAPRNPSEWTEEETRNFICGRVESPETTYPTVEWKEGDPFEIHWDNFFNSALMADDYKYPCIDERVDTFVLPGKPRNGFELAYCDGGAKLNNIQTPVLKFVLPISAEEEGLEAWTFTRTVDVHDGWNILKLHCQDPNNPRRRFGIITHQECDGWMAGMQNEDQFVLAFDDGHIGITSDRFAWSGTDGSYGTTIHDRDLAVDPKSFLQVFAQVIRTVEDIIADWVQGEDEG